MPCYWLIKNIRVFHWSKFSPIGWAGTCSCPTLTMWLNLQRFGVRENLENLAGRRTIGLRISVVSLIKKRHKQTHIFLSLIKKRHKQTHIFFVIIFLVFIVLVIVFLLFCFFSFKKWRNIILR